MWQIQCVLPLSNHYMQAYKILQKFYDSVIKEELTLSSKYYTSENNYKLNKNTSLIVSHSTRQKELWESIQNR